LLELVRVVALLIGLVARSCRFRGRPSPEHSSASYEVTQVFWPRASGTSPSSDFSPDAGHPFTFSAYRCAFAPRSLHVEHAMRPPGVTSCSSAPCQPHTPWFEGWMDNAFVTIAPTRPCPLFGRPVHHRDSSHRFRPGASPQALRIPPHDGHPALLHSYRGQRGVTPAFGYDAPHPSTSGTSTHLSTSLPSAHYARC